MYNLSRNRNKLKGGEDVDRTRQSLKAFVGLNRTLDTLEKIVQRDVKIMDLILQNLLY